MEVEEIKERLDQEWKQIVNIVLFIEYLSRGFKENVSSETENPYSHIVCTTKFAGFVFEKSSDDSSHEGNVYTIRDGTKESGDVIWQFCCREEIRGGRILHIAAASSWREKLQEIISNKEKYVVEAKKAKETEITDRKEKQKNQERETEKKKLLEEARIVGLCLE